MLLQINGQCHMHNILFSDTQMTPRLEQVTGKKYPAEKDVHKPVEMHVNWLWRLLGISRLILVKDQPPSQPLISPNTICFGPLDSLVMGPRHYFYPNVPHVSGQLLQPPTHHPRWVCNSLKYR